MKINDGNEKDIKKYKKESLDETRGDLFGGKKDAYLPDEDTMDFIPGVDDIDHFDFDENDMEHYRKLNEMEAEEKARRRREKLEERRRQRSAQEGEKRTKKAGEKNAGEKKNGDKKVGDKKGGGKKAGGVGDRREEKGSGGAKKKAGMSLTDKKRRRKNQPAEAPDENDEQLRRELAEKRRTNKEIMRVTYVMMILFFGMIGYFIYFDAVSSKDVINNAHNSRLAKMAESVQRGEILSADGAVLAESVDDGSGNYERYYPYGCTFAHVVGTSDINQSGIELSADYELITSDIQPLQKVFNEIRGIKNPGNNVITTLDANLQQVAHDALGDRQGVVVALEPSTGKVLAMVSKPDYDPNTLAANYQDIINDTDSKVLLNQSTQGLFVPGSIFKIVTTLAYWRDGGDSDSYSYYCNGSIFLDTEEGESYIKCYNGEVHGQLDLIDSFAHSCNASYANLGLSIDLGKMNAVCEELLFNQSLPTRFTTSKSQFGLSSDDSDWQIGATAIGQGNTLITPMHAAMLTSAIANGGTLMEPYVIDEIQNADGTVQEKYMPESYGSLMSATEAAKLTELMEAVVDYGTGYRLSGRSYGAAGKTGTAEVMGRGNNAWFVGFAPADNPEIAICVLVEDAGTASSETVPIAAEIFDAYLD